MVKLAEPKRVPPDVVIDEIVRTIVEKVRPRRLILFGSRARGDARPDSDYDVVVEMDAAIASSWDFAREIDALFKGANGWSLNVFPRSLGEIEAAANDPGAIDWDIVREGTLLYAAEGVSSVLAAPPLKVSEGPREIPPTMRDWSDRALRDLKHARWSASSGSPWEYVCYFSQQSAEKFLKAVLVRHFVHPERTHNLEKLLDAATAADLPLVSLRGDCALLTPFAIDARYGDLEKFDEATGRAALAAAERIAAAVIPLLD